MKKNNKGFTLVELIVVIAILGVLMAVLIPQYIQYVEKSRIGVDESYIGEVAHNMELAAAANEKINGKSVTVTLEKGKGKIALLANDKDNDKDAEQAMLNELAAVFPDQFDVDKETGTAKSGTEIYKSKTYRKTGEDSEKDVFNVTVTLQTNGTTIIAGGRNEINTVKTTVTEE